MNIGMIRIEWTSADMAHALGAINAAGIPVESMVSDNDLTATFWISRRHYQKLRDLASKRGEHLQVLSKKGLFWELSPMKKRPVLLFGLALLICLATFLPTRVCFVQVEGNQRIPTRAILEAAAESGVRFGATRRQLHNEQIKNQLLSSIPELQWAGVNTYGCVAVISVRERTQTEEADSTTGVCSLVASRAGIILSCTATRGNLLCPIITSPSEK